MPPSLFTASEHIKALLSVGAYSLSMGELMLVGRVHFVFLDSAAAPLLSPPFAVQRVYPLCGILRQVMLVPRFVLWRCKHDMNL